MSNVIPIGNDLHAKIACAVENQINRDAKPAAVIILTIREDNTFSRELITNDTMDDVDIYLTASNIMSDAAEQSLREAETE